MTKLKLSSAVLIAAAMLATPAMARTGHVTSRHRARYASAGASRIGHVGISAPRAGGFPPAPPDGENCDVGDNPFIC
jgi:hypothetical protein